jgi:hypothetical protein
VEEKERILSARYNEEIVKNAHLIEENSYLKHQLEKRVQPRVNTAAAAPQSGNSSEKETSTHISLEEYQGLAKKFEDLNQKYQEALQRIRYVERKNAAVMQKNKEMKERVLEWQHYLAKGHKPKPTPTPCWTKEDWLKAMEEHSPLPPLASSPAPAILRTPRTLQGTSSPAPTVTAASARLQQRREGFDHPQDGADTRALAVAGADLREEGDLPHPLENDQNPRDDIPQAIGVDGVVEHQFEMQEQPDERITSSQTEDDVMQDAEAAMPPPPKPQDDDIPEFVFERTLKRKRQPQPKFKIYNDRVPSDGTPSKPVRVKEEPGSSPPAPTPSNSLLRKDTLDLDELGPHVISTPHGRRLRSHARNIATLRHQRSSSVPLIKEERTEGGESEPHHGHLAPQRTASGESRALSEPFAPVQGGTEPLKEIDPNSRMPNLEEDGRTPSKRQKKDTSRIRTLHNVLAESGESPPPVDEDQARLTPKAARARYNQRLRAKKAIQTPDNKTLKTPASAAAKLETSHTTTPGPTDSRLKFAPLFRPGSRDGAQSEPRPKRQPPTSTTRIRDKPVSELKLSDFKPNPIYNQGYSYAFAETVRKRADRACLMGCTRPECCGSTFRALAAAAPPLSASQEEKLLEDYLGDAYDNMRLTQMSADEKNELVLQARTREMANKHGKHRHAYERQRTPPGFWRVDFPTTQEEREDREKAAELERKAVLERRAEALRKGGRYVFRDE